MMGLGGDFTPGYDGSAYTTDSVYGTNSSGPSYYGSDYGSSGSSGGFDWGAVTGIASAFTSVFRAIQPLPSGCIQVAGPYGMSTQCGNSASQPTLGISSSLSSLGMSGSTLLLIGGAVVVIMMMKKG